MIDEVAKNELLARLYFKNNQAPKALACMEFLLNLNSMNVSYFELALKYQGIDVTKPEDAEKMVAALEVYEKKFNKSSTPVRVALNRLSASSPDFKRKLLQYLRPLIIKGVPSVINDLKSFYKNEPEKTKILGSILENMSKNMNDRMTLEDDSVQDP